MATANGILDIRSAWSPSYTSTRCYQEVEKIHAILAMLAKEAKGMGYSNVAISDMYADVLIKRGYGGDVNATATAFNSVYISVIQAG